MPKKPKGRCVHCLRASNPLDWDHGYPRSWYPDGSSAAKPKAPSCRGCQIRLERAENAALIPFALSLATDDPRAAGVPEAVLRSINPALAKTERERRARQAKREELEKLMVFPTDSRGAFPGFAAEDVGALTPAVKLDSRDVLIVGEKFVRVALWFLRDGQYVETSHRIGIHVVNAADVPAVEALVRRGDKTTIAPGAVMTLCSSSDEPRTHLILFELWGRLKLFASVLPVGADAT